MPPTSTTNGSGRETRLLLVTIAVSVGALLLLARYRFPAESFQPTEPAPAPLERLAARAAYDELASAMADLERRITPRVVVFGVTPARASGAYAIAPRVTADRAIAILDPDEDLDGTLTTVPALLSHDTDRGLAVFDVPVAEEAVVTPRIGQLRQGPRYVVIVEGTSQGPTLRPVYVGRTSSLDVGAAASSLLILDAVQAPLPRGAAVFSLEGTFLGLVSQPGPTTIVIGGDALTAIARGAQRTAGRPRGDLGLDVQEATPALLKAAGTDRGVVVSYVRPGGPAADLLAPGDVLRDIDGQNTWSVTAFRQTERTRTPGEPVTVTVVRRGIEEKITYRAADATATGAPDALGITGRSVPGVGIEVVAVSPGSLAARAGMLRGDLILTADGRPVSDYGAIVRGFNALPSGSSIVLSVERGGEHRVLALEKP